MKFGVSWVWVRDVGRDGRSRGRQRRKGHSKARIAFRKRSSYSYFLYLSNLLSAEADVRWLATPEWEQRANPIHLSESSWFSMVPPISTSRRAREELGAD